MQFMQNVMVKEMKPLLNWRGSLSMPAWGHSVDLFGRLSAASVDIVKPLQEVLRMVGMVAVEDVSPLPTLVRGAFKF